MKSTLRAVEKREYWLSDVVKIDYSTVQGVLRLHDSGDGGFMALDQQEVVNLLDALALIVEEWHGDE